MHRLFRNLAFTSLVLALTSGASLAHAAVTPTLSFTAVGDGNTVTVHVTGEASKTVTMFYTLPDMSSRQQPLGSTDAQGSLTKDVNSTNFYLTPGTIIYVTLKGTEGPELQSSYVAWPQLGVASTNTSTTNTTTSSNPIAAVLSKTAITVAMGGDATFTITGSGTPYSVFTASDGIAVASISGMTVTVYGLSLGSSSGSVCSAAGPCTPFTISVSNNAPAPVVTQPVVPVTTVVTASAPIALFTSALSVGSTGDEVTALQNLLVSLGYLTATPNGFFGSQTQAAVMKFQAAHGLSQVGNVGPGTRLALNQLSGGGTTSSGSVATSASTQLASPIASMGVAELRTVVASLVTQLAQIANRLAQLGG